MPTSRSPKAFPSDFLQQYDPDSFIPRHLGPRPHDVDVMLQVLEVASIDELINDTIPSAIRTANPLSVGDPVTEQDLQRELRRHAAANEVYRTFIGMGYYNTFTPTVIQRNLLENPGWYTAYTPYQAEISQGRLEALLVFQTMVEDLTALPVANASLLDEATAAAEAMTMLYRSERDDQRTRFLVANSCHPQTLAVLKTRALPQTIDLDIQPVDQFDLDNTVFGILLQYPATDGEVADFRSLINSAHQAGVHVVMTTDLLALTLLTPPGELGADVAVGSSQRFGVPPGYGGPHAAFFATTENFKRKIPGRIIGVSVDRHGAPAYRMALQTREQHIRRDRATSNICTAQVLLANMAAMYAVYHGPEGLRSMAHRIHQQTRKTARLIRELGHEIMYDSYFDTLRIRLRGMDQETVRYQALREEINLRYYDNGDIGLSLDETTRETDISDLGNCFRPNSGDEVSVTGPDLNQSLAFPESLQRKRSILNHPVFHQHHSETAMLRYLHKLESRDLSLTTSMIPLGSCTMKLNGTTEMMPITWPEFATLHPFIPADQALGYQPILSELETWLKDITGLPAVSFQPNSGAQGEYTGLMIIREYHRRRGDKQRQVCLIPASAHGTNPASSVMAGMKAVVVQCDDQGNIDLEDLKTKTEQHSRELAALMVTYPSTHGVFEEGIITMCDVVHDQGGLVYMDGANLNAMVGLCRPGEFGADVIHINLHKTFSIPHGGGGPGMGPICASETLAPYLPTHPLNSGGGERGISAVSAAPFGSADILLISWAYIKLMGSEGLTEASRIAVLNANYMAARLKDNYPVLYTGKNDLVGHEFIIDLRPFRKSSGITEEDVAKRLMDYGFHAPTMSFPVPGTLMIEPTESESKAELDRLCDALISIRKEIDAIASGDLDIEDNPLKMAPHTVREVTADTWTHPYRREQAAWPAPWLKEHKFWPRVARIDNAYGDRNLMCACPA